MGIVSIHFGQSGFDVNRVSCNFYYLLLPSELQKIMINTGIHINSLF